MAYNPYAKPPLQQSVSFQPAPADEDRELGLGTHTGADFKRKRSLVKPDRERIEPGHRLWHYKNHAAAEGAIGVQPSSTGNRPIPRRGKSILERSADDGSLTEKSSFGRKRASAIFTKQRGVDGGSTGGGTGTEGAVKKGAVGLAAIPGPVGPWMIYCYGLTICFPAFLLHRFGLDSPERIRAWREKIGIISLVTALMAAVGFITFGFTQTVCPAGTERISSGRVDLGNLIINGRAYDLSTWKHPAAGPYFSGNSSPLYEGWNAGGMDASFMFQNVNKACKDIILPAQDTSITHSGNLMAWYFPCNLFNEQGTTTKNYTGYTDPTNCHTSQAARSQFEALGNSQPVSYTWENVTNPARKLVVYEETVLDLDLLNWLLPAEVSIPAWFTALAAGNITKPGDDITMYVKRNNMGSLASCLQDIISVGEIDTISIGCVASDVVLYVSLVFILGVVFIKFAMAVLFGWFFSWKIGKFPQETYEQRMQRSAEVEAWTDDIYRPAPSRYRPNVLPLGKSKKGSDRKSVFNTSRFSKADTVLANQQRPATTYIAGGRATSIYGGNKSLLNSNSKLTPPGSPDMRLSRSSQSLPADISESMLNCPFPLHNVVPQPPQDYEPFNFPLAHAICLVTAYSESAEGLRTTLDSLATTDYPNSHKIILVIADGVVQGSGNNLTTPDIVLGMMKDLAIPRDEVEAHSYIAIADGHKRHNMARVFAGFYDYDNSTTELSKQQRVPMLLVAKVGNPLEAHDPKPGNRGKRDSQVLLMSFLQKVMFDERMTMFEYEMFNSFWRVTGVTPDNYQVVLMVDADTKVFPDCLTRMTSCMVCDPEIMGLCGETKIANKSDSWVTRIQVFEYYISHHLTKAFESMFGGVTCLPGCFSMYRIKAPKGEEGYWVPVLANPDVVEHYSENVVDTLHKKNLLLLGEDRFLSTLMLKTFPKRKMIFCPQAVCKTIVPEQFTVLLSQRRRWINSTVHNLAELLLVRDLCGTFCFSMQFVVFMELTGTLVLPAAIAFTIYLIIASIVAAVNHTTIPVVPLILLAFILGLPGLLIVITSRKLAFVGWMGIYLLSLPVWNFVLPSYAFWHMDDFSWGATRKLSTEDDEVHTGDRDGIFDSSHIVMKRWAEFERDRKWKGGIGSQDQAYDPVVVSSARKANSNRFSMTSSSDTHPNSLQGVPLQASSSQQFLRDPSNSYTSPVRSQTQGINSPAGSPLMSPEYDTNPFQPTLGEEARDFDESSRMLQSNLSPMSANFRQENPSGPSQSPGSSQYIGPSRSRISGQAMPNSYLSSQDQLRYEENLGHLSPPPPISAPRRHSRMSLGPNVSNSDSSQGPSRALSPPLPSVPPGVGLLPPGVGKPRQSLQAPSPYQQN